jgi:transcriptional regulator with XRE-family HTH domain
VSEPFAELLQRLRESRGLSRAVLARRSGLDAGYLTRCEQGQRVPTGRPAVARIAAALECSETETNALLVAAGFLPDELACIGADDPTILLLARLLAPGALPEETQKAVRGVVQSLGQLLVPTREKSSSE